MAKVNIALDATMLDTFETCPCKYDYRFNMSLVSEEKPEALDAGSLIHVGLENYYKCLKAGIEYTKAVEAALVATRYAIATESDLSSGDASWVLDTIEENIDYWRIADQSYMIGEVEKSFAYILYEDDFVKIIMIGKIDLLVSDNSYTNLPIDHKSFKRDFPVRKRTNQFCNYAVATGSNFLLVNRVGLQKTLKPQDKFKRVPLSYDHLFLDAWKRNTVKVIMKYYDCVESNDWPMNNTSCDKYNRLCEYSEVCDTSGDENKIYKLETNFKKDKPWDVSRILAQKD